MMPKNRFIRELEHQQRVDERNARHAIKVPVEWRRMTDLEQRAALRLTHVSFVPGTATKRLARSLSGQASTNPPQITERQAKALWGIVWRYRRQIDDEYVRIAREMGFDTSVN
jgi:hypothetical protein